MSPASPSPGSADSITSRAALERVLIQIWVCRPDLRQVPLDKLADVVADATPPMDRIAVLRTWVRMAANGEPLPFED